MGMPQPGLCLSRDMEVPPQKQPKYGQVTYNDAVSQTTARMYNGGAMYGGMGMNPAMGGYGGAYGSGPFLPGLRQHPLSGLESLASAKMKPATEL